MLSQENQALPIYQMLLWTGVGTAGHDFVISGFQVSWNETGFPCLLVCSRPSPTSFREDTGVFCIVPTPMTVVQNGSYLNQY
jgi:hypothetical protein